MGVAIIKISQDQMNVDAWPDNLKNVDLRGNMTLTELWMVKESITAGSLKAIGDPEKAYGAPIRYYTLYSNEGIDDAYVILTTGHPAEPAWCMVTAVNKINKERASRLLSGWPYE